MRSSIKVAAGAGALAIVGTAGFVAWGHFGSQAAASDAPPATTMPARTATVEQVDLTESTEFSGTITYTDSRTVSVVLPTAEGAIVTASVDLGDQLTTGEQVATIDGLPLVAIDGSVPMYRTLEHGIDDGPDVAQLERFLVDNGFDPDGDVTVDDHFSTTTDDAVERWEESLGLLEPDGEVPASQVVFVDGPAVVTAVHADVGAIVAHGSPLVDVALVESGRVVNAEVPLTDQEMLAPGTEVSVEVGDSIVAGRVVAVLPVATTNPADEPMATVEISVPGTVRLDLVSAPVTVSTTETVAANATVVPVAALVALSEGGYGVRLVDGSGWRLVGVTTGAFNDSYVEVDGAGVRPGAEVIVP